MKTQIIAKWSSNTYIDYHPAIVDWKSFTQWIVSCFDNDTNIVKWMVTKIIYRHSITHMLQPAFQMCVLAVLILFQRCSMFLFRWFPRNSISYLRSSFPFWVFTTGCKKSEKNYTLQNVNTNKLNRLPWRLT